MESVSIKSEPFSIEVTFYYYMVYGVDKITYASKNLILSSIKSTPRHFMDTERILYHENDKLVADIEKEKRTFEDYLRNSIYKGENIRDITFVDKRNEELPHKVYNF